jgi:SOUL heme-binding protein
MSATHAVSGFSRGPRRPVGILIARISEKAQRLWSPNWLPFRSNEAADELIVEHHGPVEIHQTLAGWSLETCVKGEPDRARATAVRRLGNYASGKNRSRARLRVTRPLVQAEEGAGRWWFRVASPSVDSEFAATSARNGKIRLRALESETLAVIRVPGRPTKLAIHHAETAIRLAIASTRWQPTGGAMLRLHTLPAVLPFLGRFEVAVPVAERTPDSAMPDWMRQVVFNHPAATQPAPPVR